MTREQIIRMAREAEIFTGGHPMNPWSVYPSDLERFAALVAAAERHECALIIEQYAHPRNDAYVASYVLRGCAEAIRARGEK